LLASGFLLGASDIVRDAGMAIIKTDSSPIDDGVLLTGNVGPAKPQGQPRIKKMYL
jgi:hypothetical protein